jgi:hypothetical protein
MLSVFDVPFEHIISAHKCKVKAKVEAAEGVGDRAIERPRRIPAACSAMIHWCGCDARTSKLRRDVWRDV